MDARTKEFLDLVDCDPRDVQDCEPERRGVDYSKEAEKYQLAKPSQVEVWFGKHKGKKISQIPKGYLEWLASDKFTGQEKIKNAATKQLEFLQDRQAAMFLAEHDKKK